MTPSELEEAVFWDQLVCLDCGAVHNPPEGQTSAEAADLACSVCGSDAVYSATFISRIADFVREEPSDG